MSDKTHSHIGASGAYRWFVCPGSPRMIAKHPEKTESVYALEGTAAHGLAEYCLDHAEDAKNMVGEDYMGLLVTEEHAEAIQVYLDTVRTDLMKLEEQEERNKPILTVEHKFDLSALHPGLYGTNDALIQVPFKKLVVYDYKHGAGIPVEVENNPQLLYYALGAYETLPFADFEELELVIVQPRCAHRTGPVRRWVVSVNELLAFKQKLVQAARATEDPEAPLVAGNHCKFCSALAVCPEARKQVEETAIADFRGNPPTPKLPDPEALSMEQIKRALDLSQLIKDWIKAVEAHAQNQLQHGVNIPGYKLVKKRSNRKWIDEDDVIQDFEPVLGEDIYNKKLKSPAQLEKLFGKKNKGELEPYYDSPDTGETLVPESDKRAAVPPSAITDFQEK